MRIGLIAVLTVAALCTAIAAETPTSSGLQGPKRAVLYPNYGPPPDSIDELWDAADLIVRGVIENSHVRRSTPTGRATVVTDHRLRVSEVLKGAVPGTDHRVVHVLQSAGTLVVDGTEITVDPGSMPVLAPHQEILVFLNKWTNGAGYSITAGPAGLYVLDDERVTIPNFMTPVVGGKANVAKDDFLAALRKRAGTK